MANAALTTILLQPKYELIPMKGVEKQVPHLPGVGKVSVTCSPTKGIPATIELVKTVRQQVAAETIIPHIAARMVEGEEHLGKILTTLQGIGIREVFVVGGDHPEPKGPYSGSFDLVKAIYESEFDFGIGSTAYPEGHADIPDDVLMADLKRKDPYVDYVATQMCFDPNSIQRWIEHIRAEGVQSPIHLGVPGVIDIVKLISISSRIGIGDSLRYLKKHSGNVIKLMGGYSPDHLIDEMMSAFENPDYNIEEFHLYSFNQVKKTESWRSSKLASLQEVA